MSTPPVPSACPECGHTMTPGSVGPTLLWCCARCGAVTLRSEANVTDGARLLLELTRARSSCRN